MRLLGSKVEDRLRWFHLGHNKPHHIRWSLTLRPSWTWKKSIRNTIWICPDTNWKRNRQYIIYRTYLFSFRSIYCLWLIYVLAYCPHSTQHTASYVDKKSYNPFLKKKKLTTEVSIASHFWFILIYYWIRSFHKNSVPRHDKKETNQLSPVKKRVKENSPPHQQRYNRAHISPHYQQSSNHINYYTNNGNNSNSQNWKKADITRYSFECNPLR